MGRNIFISYKYKDDKVYSMNKTKFVFIGAKLTTIARSTIVRDYVDALQSKLKDDHINLGEKDGESLADFSDEQIASSLKQKIFQSSITIVLISKGMKTSEPEKEQWIPWEVSYSLRTVKRADTTSRMNAILGIVLPDETGSYDWYYAENPQCNSVTHKTEQLFNMLKSNMFNIKKKTTRECNGTTIIEGESSFIKTVKWEVFTHDKNYNFYIEKAIEIRGNKDLYEPKIKLD